MSLGHRESWAFMTMSGTGVETVPSVGLAVVAFSLGCPDGGITVVMMTVVTIVPGAFSLHSSHPKSSLHHFCSYHEPSRVLQWAASLSSDHK